jgi:hypothetical protein
MMIGFVRLSSGKRVAVHDKIAQEAGRKRRIPAATPAISREIVRFRRASLRGSGTTPVEDRRHFGVHKRRSDRIRVHPCNPWLIGLVRLDGIRCGGAIQHPAGISTGGSRGNRESPPRSLRPPRLDPPALSSPFVANPNQHRVRIVHGAACRAPTSGAPTSCMDRIRVHPCNPWLIGLVRLDGIRCRRSDPTPSRNFYRRQQRKQREPSAISAPSCEKVWFGRASVRTSATSPTGTSATTFKSSTNGPRAGCPCHPETGTT